MKKNQKTRGGKQQGLPTMDILNLEDFAGDFDSPDTLAKIDRLTRPPQKRPVIHQEPLNGRPPYLLR